MNTAKKLDDDFRPEPDDQGKLAVFLLALWIANVIWFLAYFILHGIPGLTK